MAMALDELQSAARYYCQDRVSEKSKSKGRPLKTPYVELRSCRFCGRQGHLIQSCPEKQRIHDEMLAEKRQDKEYEEMLAKIRRDTSDPLPLQDEDGTIRWQGDEVAGGASSKAQTSLSAVA